MQEKLKDRYIDPFTDFGFKKLFGEECNKDLLLDFLNELLHREEGKIVSLSYLKTERLGISEESRKAIFDIHCENENGEKKKTAVKLFKKGMSIEDISDTTELPIAQIKELIKEIGHGEF